MKQFSPELDPYWPKAKKQFTQGWVKSVEFSGATYQVQIINPETTEEIWVFLQLDNKGGIKDCFCSTEDEEVSYCVHIATALLRIYNGFQTPLHERFQHSLWNKLCEIYAERVGDNPKLILPISNGEYRYDSPGGTINYSISAKGELYIQRLKEILEQRKPETEETSLKFSNLSPEELKLWRKGKPTNQLRYELSFWNDIAHWLMELQENKKPYKISFEYSEQKIPNKITIKFPSLEMSFSLSEMMLSQIIPNLHSVDTPLKVHMPAEVNLSKATYDKNKGVLYLYSQEKGKKPPQNYAKGIKISNEWIFIPDDGFYPYGQNELLTAQELKEEQIAEAFEKYRDVLKSILENETLHVEHLRLNYYLNFDENWNLHIEPYAFQKGDLRKANSRQFGNWLYIDSKGFYQIEDSSFVDAETVIPKEKVSDFVWQERIWLNTQPGFTANLASVEPAFAYVLSDDSRLSFKRQSPVSGNIGGHDFGAWIYIPERGFYAKATSSSNLPMYPKQSIAPEQIPLFIRNNFAELSVVEKFFSEKSPVVASGLIVSLNEEDSIEISPHYELLPEYKEKEVQFFEDFVYVNGEGFSELPKELRLPEKFHHTVIIEPEKVAAFLKSDWEFVKKTAFKIDPRITPIKEIQLFSSGIDKKEENYFCEFNFQTERGVVSIKDMWEALRQKKRFLFSEAGSIDLESSHFDWLRTIQSKQFNQKKNVVALSTLEFIRLHALEGIHLRGSSQNIERSREFLEEITQFKIPDIPNVSGLKSELRPYQKFGVHWLWFLYSHGLSGLLSDEMGLGKTHQAMALFSAIAHDRGPGKHHKPFLVICPTSVLYHWEEKLQEFMPQMRVCTFHGTQRSLVDIEQYDVLVTSYGIWRMEHKMLSTIPFEVAILDEIQIAKNQNSRIHASLRNIQAKTKIGMTGTPIENQLRELKSLFDLILPGYMPGERVYRELFIKPIEKEGDGKRKYLLSKFVKPFVLRRKKIEVLPDLPEKTEEISHCDLSGEQKLLYQKVLMQSREKILEQLQDDTSTVPYMHIFSILSSLKQICNHPAVYLKSPEKFREYPSGKWDLFIELLNEARDSNQKVVVFSQYLHMLDIIEDYLSEMKIGYATIRGSTLNRGEQVHRFNHDPNCEVFVGSLKAAGLGVDLTAGSVVIHYDRWWNAARENQATDRVHRIGQKKGVQVFKLVTKGTFEERIDALINKKAKLLEEVIAADDHRFMKTFNREELIQLLLDVEETK